MGSSTVVCLVPERVLDIVSGLLIQPVEYDRALIDLESRFHADRMGNRLDFRFGWLLPGPGTSPELIGGADIAEFPDPEVAIIVSLGVGVSDSA